MTVEDLLREAITQHTAGIPNPPDRWDEIEARAAALAQNRHQIRRGKARKAGWAALGLVAAAVAALVIVPLVHRDSKQRISTRPPATHPAPATTVAPSLPPSPPPSPSGPKVTATPTTTATRSPATGIRSSISPYQPLWPFRTLAEASNWEATSQAGGHQPWHLDAGQTALSFTNSYLGYTEIDKVIKQTVDSKGAHVAVGYSNPNGALSTAAVIHLVRFGTGATAPWEVVGTDDPTSFALTTPAYGARVTSPAMVRGTITGVDESVRVQVLQLSSSSPLGTAPGVAAGGSASPWQTTVSWQGATDSVLTIAASTGGHLQGVERFTVTAVTAGK
jgi:hypothetical protein